MKTGVMVLLAMLMVFAVLFGCAEETVQPMAPESTSPGEVTADFVPENTTVDEPNFERISIVCAIFPQYDWVREIAGDRINRFELSLLMDNLVDLHNYQPSFSDIVLIAECDIFVHVGGHSDEWVEDVLRQATNPDMIVINMLEILGDDVKMSQILEGMQTDCEEDECEDDSHDHDHGHSHGHSHDHSHDHDDDDDDDDEHDHDHEHEDEHVWLSLRLAKVLCTVLTDVLSEVDPAFVEEYRSNLAAYIDELDALDSDFRAIVEASSVDTLVFADRFPFRYFVDDYGLHYYAAFSGCSAETEASFSTIVFLASKIDELGFRSIMVTESADQSIAETVIDNTQSGGQRILVLNAMQSVVRSEIDEGITYLSIMKDNLSVLREALI